MNKSVIVMKHNLEPVSSSKIWKALHVSDEYLQTILGEVTEEE